MSQRGTPFFVPTSRIQWAKQAGFINLALASNLEEDVGGQDQDVTQYDRFEVRLQEALDRRAIETKAAQERALQDERRDANASKRKAVRRARSV